MLNMNLSDSEDFDPYTQSDVFFGENSFADPALPVVHAMAGHEAKEHPGDIRKRKSSLMSSSPSMEVDEEDEKMRRIGFEFEGVEGRKYTRQHHSEIEKRRRDKMNSYITELATMIPMCSAMDRKLDKLTVLRMAVQHMKTLRGAAALPTEIQNKPEFLSDEELKHLMIKAADGFLFVVSCDRGRILYVSESVQNILHFKQPELIGQSIFDIILHKDVAKVKEQLLSSDVSPRERLIDAKTMKPVRSELPQKQTQLCSGARRSFFCRMKTGLRKDTGDAGGLKTKRELDLESHPRRKKLDRRQFSVIHCSGYIKSWSRAKMGIEDDNESDGDGCNLSCLVAVGMPQHPQVPQPPAGTVPMDTDTPSGQVNLRPAEFISRHTVDGKFTYVDQRVTSVLGYLPQELIGTSVYEYYHFVDINHLSEGHRKTLKTRDKIHTQPYRIKAKDGSFVKLKSVLHGFVNPWNKDVEYIICKNSLYSGAIDCLGGSTPVTQEVTSSGQGFEEEPAVMMKKSDNIDKNMRSPMTTEVPHSPAGQHGGTQPGAGRIGRQIAEESALEIAKLNQSQTLSLFQGKRAASKAAVGRVPVTRTESGRLSFGPVSMSTAPSTAGAQHGISSSEVGTGETAAGAAVIDPELMSSSTSDGGTDSDEAAMAVIMSLLEADAGLGGPVDFSDLPWPL